MSGPCSAPLSVAAVEYTELVESALLEPERGRRWSSMNLTRRPPAGRSVSSVTVTVCVFGSASSEYAKRSVTSVLLCVEGRIEWPTTIGVKDPSALQDCDGRRRGMGPGRRGSASLRSITDAMLAADGECESPGGGGVDAASEYFEPRRRIWRLCSNDNGAGERGMCVSAVIVTDERPVALVRRRWW